MGYCNGNTLLAPATVLNLMNGAVNFLFCFGFDRDWLGKRWRWSLIG
ncbi:hypothetical protein ACFL2H_05665 [Planctomycetota bacterium]